MMYYAWRTFTTKFTFNSDETEIRVHLSNSSYTNSSGQVVFLERLLERDSYILLMVVRLQPNSVGALGIGNTNPTTVY